MRIRYVLGLLAFSVIPSALAGQGSCPALQAGSTVRLHGASTATYTLPQAVQPTDTAIIPPPAGVRGRAPVRCADLERVQLRVGTGSRARSALRGAGVGLLVGSVVGAGIGYLAFEQDDSDWQIFDRNETTLMGAVYVGGLSAALGGVIGYVSPKSEWREVPIGTSQGRRSAEGLRIAPAGGARVRLSYTLPL